MSKVDMRTSFIAGSRLCVLLSGLALFTTQCVFIASGQSETSASGASNPSLEQLAKSSSTPGPKVRRYSLNALLEPAGHRFSGIAKIEIVDAKSSKPLVLLLNAQFNVTSVREGDKPVAFTQGRAEREAKPLLVQLPGELGAADYREISISYEGTIQPPGPQDPDWMGALVIRTNEIRMTEQSKWYPMLAGARAPVEASIQLPDPFTLIWSGTSRKSTENRGQTTWNLSITNPAAPALLAGIYKTVEKSSVAVCLFPESAAAAQTVLEQAVDILTFFESRFGPRPFESVAVCEMRVLNRRASYNFACPGAVVFPTELIRMAQRPERKEFWTRKLAHELAHQWWGCGVDLPHEPWPVHESLAELSAALYLQSLHADKSLADCFAPEDLENIRRLSALARRGFPPTDREYRQCLGYEKGPRVLAMLREIIGSAPFDQALRAFYSQYCFRQATQEQFQGSFGHSGVIPPRQFFEQWTERRLLPQLKVEAIPADEAGKPITLRFQQTDPVFAFPVELRLTSATGPVFTSCVLTQAQQEIQTRIPGPLLYFEVDPSGKLLLETQHDTTSLVQCLTQAKTAYRGLLAAQRTKQPESLDPYAKELRDIFRRFTAALEIELHRQRLAARGPIDAKTALQLDDYEALKATLQTFFSGVGEPAQLGLLMRSIAEAADDIHDALRDKKLENIAPAITTLSEAWDQLSREGRAQSVLQ